MENNLVEFSSDKYTMMHWSGKYTVLHILVMKIVQPVTILIAHNKNQPMTLSVELDSISLCSKKSAKFPLSWFSTHSHLMNLIKANIPI
jgi:hypothetical protein